MIKSIKYAVIGILIVLAPLVFLALHNYRRLDQANADRERIQLNYMTCKPATVEDFAASQGGAQVQLASSHVASEEEVAANLEIQKRQVVRDIINMTESDLVPGRAVSY
jgi:hypothetical protein